MRARRWKRVLKIALPGLVAVLVGIWFILPRESDRDLILDLVARVKHGVETKSANEIIGCVARDYGEDGGLSRADIFRLAWRWERSSETADVIVDEHEVDVTPPTATGRFDVRVIVTEGGREMPPLRFEIEVEFEKQRRGLRKVWLIKSSSGHGLEKGFESFL